MSQSKPISFRLSGATLEELDRRAEALGVSRSKLAAGIVRAALESDLERELLAELRTARADLSGLREDLARTLVALLSEVSQDKAGEKFYPADGLKESVRRYLGRS